MPQTKEGKGWKKFFGSASNFIDKATHDYNWEEFPIDFAGCFIEERNFTRDSFEAYVAWDKNDKPVIGCLTPLGKERYDVRPSLLGRLAGAATWYTVGTLGNKPGQKDHNAGVRAAKEFLGHKTSTHHVTSTTHKTPPATASKPTPPATASKPTPPAMASKPTPPAMASKPTPPAMASKPTPPPASRPKPASYTSSSHSSSSHSSSSHSSSSHSSSSKSSSSKSKGIGLGFGKKRK